MTRQGASIAVTLLCCLFAVATSASAESAWVLWASGADLPYTILGAYSSVKECEEDLATYAASFKKAGYAVHGAHPKSHEFDVEKGNERKSYLCLPNTVDPHGPKGK